MSVSNMKGCAKVYKPKFGFYPYLITSFSCAYGAYLIWMALKENTTSLKITLLVTSFLIISPSIFFILIYPTMRYELREDFLLLRCGPFKATVKYKNILIISKTNLKYDITSTGWKLPGYALFNIYYSDRGSVRMFATRLLKDILLIQTVDNKLFGITPKEEGDFLLKLKKRVEE